MDLLFHIYRKSPDPLVRIDALTKARDIILDWIAKNPPPAPHGSGVYTDNKPWGPKVAGDRVPYIAYLTRALAYEQQAVPPDTLIDETARRGPARLAPRPRGVPAATPTSHGRTTRASSWTSA